MDYAARKGVDVRRGRALAAAEPRYDPDGGYAFEDPRLRWRMRRRLLSCSSSCIAVPAVALAADTDPKKQITAADQAKARSMLLKRTDFAAGWKKVAADTGLRRDTCPGFNPDESDLTLTGEAEADFEHTQGPVPSARRPEVYATKARRAEVVDAERQAGDRALPRATSSRKGVDGSRHQGHDRQRRAEWHSRSSRRGRPRSGSSPG